MRDGEEGGGTLTNGDIGEVKSYRNLNRRLTRDVLCQRRREVLRLVAIVLPITPRSFAHGYPVVRFRGEPTIKRRLWGMRVQYLQMDKRLCYLAIAEIEDVRYNKGLRVTSVWGRFLFETLVGCLVSDFTDNIYIIYLAFAVVVLLWKLIHATVHIEF